MSKQNNLTEIWNVYNNTIIQEGKVGSRPIEGGMKKMGLKPGKGGVDLNSTAAQNIRAAIDKLSRKFLVFGTAKLVCAQSVSGKS